MLSDPFALPFDPLLTNQLLPVSDMFIRLRYLQGPGRWFVSASDADTGVCLTPCIPLIASYGALNDLFRPYRYKLPYSLYCVPSAASPSSPDPEAENLSEFAVILAPA